MPKNVFFLYDFILLRIYVNGIPGVHWLRDHSYIYVLAGFETFSHPPSTM